MDRDTAVSRIQRHLGFRVDQVSDITACLQDVQDELERGATLPWWILKEDQTFVLQPDSPVSAKPKEVNLPSDFIRESATQDGNMRFQQIIPGTSLFIRKMDITGAEIFFYGARRTSWDGQSVIIESEDTSFTAGTPLVYVLRKNVARFYPGPDKIYSLLWSYYGHDARLDQANLTNQWLTNAPWLLIANAGLLMATSNRDTDAVAIFKSIRDGDPATGKGGAWNDFLANVYEREVSGRNYSMGARL